MKKNLTSDEKNKIRALLYASQRETQSLIDIISKSQYLLDVVAARNLSVSKEYIQMAEDIIFSGGDKYS